MINYKMKLATTSYTYHTYHYYNKFIANEFIDQYANVTKKISFNI